MEKEKEKIYKFPLFFRTRANPCSVLKSIPEEVKYCDISIENDGPKDRKPLY